MVSFPFTHIDRSVCFTLLNQAFARHIWRIDWRIDWMPHSRTHLYTPLRFYTPIEIAIKLDIQALYFTRRSVMVFRETLAESGNLAPWGQMQMS